MITCIMLIQCERQQISPVATQLAELDGVSEVYSVSGHYDLVAILNVPGTDALSALVTQQLAAVEGIRSTETMLSLRAYGKHEMEAMFDIGGA